MRQEITREQLEALEAEHGAGNVLVLEMEGDLFAFRRYTAKDVDTEQQWRSDGRTDSLSKSMQTLLLCPEVPAAGKSPELDLKLAGEDKARMIAERRRLTEVLKTAGAQCDAFAVTLAWQCGYGWKLEKGTEPGTLLVTAKYEAGEGFSDECWLFRHKSVDPASYAEYRKLGMKDSAGKDARYIWSKLVADQVEAWDGDPCDKAALEARYAFLPIAIGDAIVQLTGAKAVSLKKFDSSGPARKP